LSIVGELQVEAVHAGVILTQLHAVDLQPGHILEPVAPLTCLWRRADDEGAVVGLVIPRGGHERGGDADLVVVRDLDVDRVNLSAAGDAGDAHVRIICGDGERDAVVAHGEDVVVPVLAEAGGQELVQGTVAELGLDIAADVHGGLGGALGHAVFADLVVLFGVVGGHQAEADAGQHVPWARRGNPRRHFANPRG